jgi:hypothetical protein
MLPVSCSCCKTGCHRSWLAELHHHGCQCTWHFPLKKLPQGLLPRLLVQALLKLLLALLLAM